MEWAVQHACRDGQNIGKSSQTIGRNGQNICRHGQNIRRTGSDIEFNKSNKENRPKLRNQSMHNAMPNLVRVSIPKKLLTG